MRISDPSGVDLTDSETASTWRFWSLLVIAVVPAVTSVALAGSALTGDVDSSASTSVPWLEPEPEPEPRLADRATAAFDAASPGLVLVTTFLLLTLTPRLRRSVPAAARWVLAVLALATTTVSLAACVVLVWTVTRDPTPLETSASGYSVVWMPTEVIGRAPSDALWPSASLAGVVTLLVLLRSRRSGGPREPDGRTVTG